jgi:hypothetical protein
MERRNSPTPLNYSAEGNNNAPYASAGMRALQIKQPFRAENRENAMLFRLNTTGRQPTSFAFAALNEGAASSLIVDYSTDGVNWTSQGIPLSTFSLSNAYQVFEVDFSGVAAAANSPSLSIRVRFDGDNMTADNGSRVTFNNFSLHGLPISTPPLSERDALMALYNATDGDNWTNKTNWLTDAPINTWFGVSTHPNGTVRTINLPNNRLTGTLPQEIGGFHALGRLILNGNRITGQIPASINNLNFLFELWLNNNR